MSNASASSGLIPDQLLNNIKKGDCVLFLGADLPLGYAGAPLSRPELAQALAAKHDLPPDRSWPETAAAYLNKVTNDRHGLIDFVREQVSGLQVKAGPLHQAVARGGFRAIVTAWYDELLEQTLREEGYRVNRVVRDVQVPYCEQGDRDVILVKLFGCISDPESLVLTKREQIGLLNRLGQKLMAIISFATIRPLLFVGYDLTDDVLIAVHQKASEGVIEHQRRAYAVWPQPTEAMRADWHGINLEFLDYSPTPLLEALSAQLPAAGAVGAPVRVSKPPYKFLDYFTQTDADIFCGRDVESQLVFRLALSGRVLTLFGPSGAGKTSLLLAGVLPRLIQEGGSVLYLRALEDPLPVLRRAIATRAGRTDEQTIGTLREVLTAMLQPTDRLVIVFDQFEELFLRVGSRNRAAFFEQVAAALKDAERDVRFIVSLREDYLSHLDEARAVLPEIFANSYRLKTLDRSNARLAITEPASRAGMQVEPALVEALVGRAEGGEGRSGDLLEADGSVSPPALQIVMDRLYRAALPPDWPTDAPPPCGLTLSLAQYQALDGASAMLAAYVDDGLAKFPTLLDEKDQPLKADVRLGEAILRVMVTSQKTKAALTQADLSSELAEAGLINPDDQADRDLVTRTRLGLERVRLLRGFQRDGVALYELAHDHMAKEIAGRISAEDMQTKVARELLHREVDNWHSSNKKLLIPREALALINERRADLKRLTSEELELLFRSALALGDASTPDWFTRAKEAGIPVEAMAQEGLRSDNFRARVAAVKSVAQLGPQFIQPIIEMLADLYPQLRVGAIHALEKLQPTGEWRAHLKYECYVPAGPFSMGDDKSAQANEHPAHEVNVEAFYIGKYPVTNVDYKRYMDAVEQPWEIPEGKDTHPVVSVSWYQSRNYTRWASMRLLTEAEWEKAASWEESDTLLVTRGQDDKVKRGRKRVYPWGDKFDKKKCNTSESGIGTTTPVGTYSPQGDSPVGCADMAGNAWEWTSSLKAGYPYRAEDGREDQSSLDARRQRGGSFIDEASDARCARRFDNIPYSGWYTYGFRCGVGVEEE